jgi:serine/threonine-protein kinase
MSHFLTIEKTENHLRFSLDHILVFDYLSHIPLNTPHFGVISKDDELEIGNILISSSSPNIMVNCLAVPDAFFALRHFKQALIEYRQISRSFLGRPEGREAIFRAGITLLEDAQEKTTKKAKEELLEQALQEFGELKNTPGAPLEYLGKSLVYKASGELEEEMKCLELALCKFAIHPLIHHIKDQILFRLHEAAYKDRKAAYHLALLTLRYIPEAFTKTDNQILLNNLKTHCKPLPFLYDSPLFIDQQIAFYLHKPRILEECFHKASSIEGKMSALFCLLSLGDVHMLPKACEEIKDHSLEVLTFFYQNDLLQTLETYASSSDMFSSPWMKSTWTLLLDPWQTMRRSIRSRVLQKLETLQSQPLPLEEHLFLQELLIRWLLHSGESSRAFSLLQTVPLKELESPPFSFFKACEVIQKQGVEKALSEISSYLEPMVPYLFGSEEKKKKFLEDLFPWEKMQLFKQLHLFYQSANMEKEARYIQKKISQELLYAKS